MSRNFAILSKAANEHPEPAAPKQQPAPTGHYHDLIRRLFQQPAAIALVGSGAESVSPITETITGTITETLAGELAGAGKRVVIVPVEMLLKMNPIVIPEQSDFAPGANPNVWTWPAPAGQKLEFFKPRETSGPANWLGSLRRQFDAVLLDCPGVSEVAAMADAAVLTVEAGRTTKEQLQKDQQALQLRGARIAGIILVRKS